MRAFRFRILAQENSRRFLCRRHRQSGARRRPGSALTAGAIGLVMSVTVLGWAGGAVAAPIHTDYAILFSGGIDQDNNRPRYYDQTLRMWNIVTQTLGFAAGNVYVLFADGTDPFLDQCVDEGGFCNDHVDSDWTAVVNAGSPVRAATHDGLHDTFSNLQSLVTSTDSFYFWSFDHGNTQNDPNDPNAVVLNAWETAGQPDVITDSEFAGWVDQLAFQAGIFAFGQCFSGGMVDDLKLGLNPNRFAAWAAAACEPSFGAGWADAWADGLEAGLRWSRSLGDYALKNDPFGPFGTGDEHPGYAGANIHIITNLISTPEPPAFLMFGVMLVTLCTFLPRRGTQQRQRAARRSGADAPAAQVLAGAGARSAHGRAASSWAARRNSVASSA